MSESIRAIKAIISEVTPDRFYYKSSDKNGHSDTVRTRIPKHWSGAIEYLIKNIKGYKCASDFFRDAIVHRIAWLGLNAQTLDPCEVAIIMSEVIAEKSIADGVAFDQMRVKVRKSLRDIIRRKNFKAATLLINQFEQMSLGMSDLYRNRMKRILAKYREQIINSKENANATT